MPSRTTFAIVAAGHIGVVALLLLGLARSPETPTSVAMQLVGVDAPRAPLSVRPEPRLIAVAAEVDAPVFEFAETEPVASITVGSGSCDLTEAVTSNLRANAAVQAALAEIPRRSRSVANAVMLWNGDWTSDETVGGRSSLAVLRLVIAASVRAAPFECRDSLVVGPRLIFVPDAVGTAVLAIGSGSWSWGQLLDASVSADNA